MIDNHEPGNSFAPDDMFWVSKSTDDVEPCIATWNYG